MKRYYLTEDIRLEKLPVRYSDKLTEKIENVEFYNKFEKENLKLWLNDLKGIVGWLSNPVIAWDNQNKYTHYDNGEIFIEKYGILFQVLTYKDKQGVEHNFVYVIDITLTPQDYNLNVPPNLFENKKYKQYNTMKNIRNKVRLTESQLHNVIKESVGKVLNEIRLPHKGGYQEHWAATNEFNKRMNTFIKELEELNHELWNIELPSALTYEMDILHYEQECINNAVKALKSYMKGKEENLMKDIDMGVKYYGQQRPEWA